MTRQELFDKWLPQFLASDKARELGIDNAKAFHDQPGTYKAAEKILGQLEIFNQNFTGHVSISSGYRQKDVNKAVGGEPDSYHTLALAVDIYPVIGSLELLQHAIVHAALWDKTIKYDLIILEPRWVHWQVCVNDIKNRKLIKDLRGK